MLWGTFAQNISICGHAHKHAHRSEPRELTCLLADYKTLHLEARFREASLSQAEPLRPQPAEPRYPKSVQGVGDPPILRTHTGFVQALDAHSFLSPFTSRSPGNAERGARRLRTSARLARRRPIPRVHANETPYRAAAPPPAARAVVTHSWGPRAAAAGLRGARSHRLLSAPGLPLLLQLILLGIFFFFFF